MPFVGAIPRLLDDAVHWNVRWFGELGDVFQVTLGAQHHLVLARPELIEAVLKGDFRLWHKSSMYDPIRLMLGQGLLTSNGAEWHRSRRLAQPAFHRHRMSDYASAIVELADAHLDTWAQADEIDASHELMSLTLSVIARLMFGADIRGEVSSIGESLGEMLRYVHRAIYLPAHPPLAWPLPQNRRFRSHRARTRAVIGRIIDARRRGSEVHSDFLGMLMQARDKDTGEGLSDEELIDQAMTIVIAGHETTALTLAWSLYELSARPGQLERLQVEVDRVLAGRTPTYEDLGELEYTTAVIHETLRLYSPIWIFVRQPVHDTELGGIEVPHWCHVNISPYLVHRHPAHWPNPNTFQPERFVAPEPQRHPFAFIPFAGGARTCIGDRVAVMEATFLLAMIAQRFHPTLACERPIKQDAKVSLRPERPIRLRLTQRGSGRAPR